VYHLALVQLISLKPDLQHDPIPKMREKVSNKLDTTSGNTMPTTHSCILPGQVMDRLLEDYKTYGELLGDENEFKEPIDKIGLSGSSPLGYFVVRLLADTYNVHIRLFQVRSFHHNPTTTIHIHALTYATHIHFQVSCSQCYINTTHRVIRLYPSMMNRKGSST
jgi:hypothetical protein